MYVSLYFKHFIGYKFCGSLLDRLIGISRVANNFSFVFLSSALAVNYLVASLGRRAFQLDCFYSSLAEPPLGSRDDKKLFWQEKNLIN